MLFLVSMQSTAIMIMIMLMIVIVMVLIIIIIIIITLTTTITLFENRNNLFSFFALEPQEGIVIVDSPGIGENAKMDEVVIQYLPEAFAFIYVINSANAGGVQQDRVSTIKRNYRSTLHR